MALPRKFYPGHKPPLSKLRLQPIWAGSPGNLILYPAQHLNNAAAAKFINNSKDFSAASTTALTSASFTPPNNCLLVASTIFANNGGSPPAAGETVTDSLGGTWTLRQTQNITAGGINMDLQFWTRPVVTGSAMTVSLSHPTSNSDAKFLTITSVENYDVASPVVTSGSKGTPIGTLGTFLLGAAPDLRDVTIGQRAFRRASAPNGSTSADPGLGWTELTENNDSAGSGNIPWISLEIQNRVFSAATDVTWQETNVEHRTVDWSIANGIVIKGIDPAALIYGPSLKLTLFPALFTDSDTFYSPTISIASGGTTLLPGLFTNVNTFYSPTIKVRLFPGLLTNTQSFFSPKIQDTLKPGLLTNAQNFFVPLLRATLKPGLLTNAQSFFSPKIQDTLKPGFLTNAQSFFSPKIQETLKSGLLTNAQSFFSPTVRAAGVVAPAFFTNQNVFYGPIIVSAGRGGGDYGTPGDRRKKKKLIFPVVLEAKAPVPQKVQKSKTRSKLKPIVEALRKSDLPVVSVYTPPLVSPEIIEAWFEQETAYRTQRRTAKELFEEALVIQAQEEEDDEQNLLATFIQLYYTYFI